MTYRLVKPTPEMEDTYFDYISEWEGAGERIVPYSSRREYGEDYKAILSRWRGEQSDDVFAKGFVPASLYFLVDTYGQILGAAHIRHQLNESLLRIGGHIGYGVRPSARGKGIATLILFQALQITAAMGIDKVLVTCDKSNIASAKTIIKNGGILENEIVERNQPIQRYWIE